MNAYDQCDVCREIFISSCNVFMACKLQWRHFLEFHIGFVYICRKTRNCRQGLNQSYLLKCLDSSPTNQTKPVTVISVNF